jgi:hypothetical protein
MFLFSSRFAISSIAGDWAYMVDVYGNGKTTRSGGTWDTKEAAREAACSARQVGSKVFSLVYLPTHAFFPVECK